MSPLPVDLARAFEEGQRRLAQEMRADDEQRKRRAIQARMTISPLQIEVWQVDGHGVWASKVGEVSDTAACQDSIRARIDQQYAMTMKYASSTELTATGWRIPPRMAHEELSTTDFVCIPHAAVEMARGELDDRDQGLFGIKASSWRSDMFAGPPPRSVSMAPAKKD